jgi:murein L,D-transpeptidase YcbB/YkuD
MSKQPHIMKKSLGALLVFGVIFLGAIHTASAFTVADLLQKVQALKSEVQTLGSNLSAAAVNSTTSATTRTTSVQAVEKLSTQLDTIESTIKTAPSSELAPAVVSPITADTIIFSQDLKSGVKSEDVVKLQDFLKAQGYFQGTSTGLFGPKTVESLKLWQNLNGINPTGVFDAKTRAVVNSLRVKAPASTDKPVPGTGGVNDCVVNSFTATPNPTTIRTAVTIS